MKNQNVRLPEQEEKKAVPKTKICQLRYAEQGTLKSRSRTGNLFQRESRKFSRNFPQFCRLPGIFFFFRSALASSGTANTRLRQPQQVCASSIKHLPQAPPCTITAFCKEFSTCIRADQSATTQASRRSCRGHRHMSSMSSSILCDDLMSLQLSAWYYFPPVDTLD